MAYRLSGVTDGFFALKRTNMEKLTVTKSVYHRNGVTGVGFFALSFSWVEDGIKCYGVATVSADDKERSEKSEDFYNPETRVLVVDAKGIVDLTRTMRGDYFHKDLLEWLKRNPDASFDFRS